MQDIERHVLNLLSIPHGWSEEKDNDLWNSEWKHVSGYRIRRTKLPEGHPWKVKHKGDSHWTRLGWWASIKISSAIDRITPQMWALKQVEEATP